MGESSGSTAVDSADGNQGTLTGGVTLGATGALPYESNTAMSFNGSTGYVNVPTNANLNITGNLTLEAWAKPTALNAVSMVIVHKGDASTYQYKLGINSSNRWRGTVYIGANTYDLAASSAAVVGRWDHLALVRNGTTLTLYVNGVSVASTSISANALNTGGGALAIGRKGSLAEDYFSGAIDEVAVYNSALSLSRITAHYQTGLPGGVTPTPTPSLTPTPLPAGSSYPTHVLADNPVGYWRLGEASGTTAYNQVSGETNGVITGGVTWGAPGALSNDSNTALTFDGTSGYVSVDNNTTLTIRNDLSLEAWTLPDAANFNGYPHVVAHKGGYQYRIRLTASGAWQGTVYINGTAYDATDSCTTLANAWYHLALTRTGSALRLYVNGVNVATNTGLPATGLLDRSSSYTPNVLGLGRKISDSPDYFKGSIDEVAVYNTALSDSRITAHYTAGRPAGFGPQGFAPLSVCQAPSTVTPTPTPTATVTPTIIPTSIPTSAGGCTLTIIRNVGGNVRRGPSADDLLVVVAPFNQQFSVVAMAVDEDNQTWYGFYHPTLRTQYISWLVKTVTTESPPVPVSQVSGAGCASLPQLNTPTDSAPWQSILGTPTLPLQPSALATSLFRGFGITDAQQYSSIGKCQHPGFDFPASALIPVYAIADGYVVGIGANGDLDRPAQWGATDGGFNLVRQLAKDSG